MNVNEIKATIDIIDLLHGYGFAVDCKNNMVCPFHKEKTGSLKVYPKNNTWHCFGCGAGNDVIDFVMQMENIDFLGALKRLGGEELSPSKKKIIQERKQNQEQLENQRKQISLEYQTVLSEYIRLDKNREIYRPTELGDALHPLFVEAIKKIEYQNYLLEKVEERQWKFEHREVDGNINTG